MIISTLWNIRLFCSPLCYRSSKYGGNGAALSPATDHVGERQSDAKPLDCNEPQVYLCISMGPAHRSLRAPQNRRCAHRERRQKRRGRSLLLLGRRRTDEKTRWMWHDPLRGWLFSLVCLEKSGSMDSESYVKILIKIMKRIA